MARQTAWVLALLMTCAPVAGLRSAGADVRQADQAQTPARDKDQKDRPQSADNRPSDRDRWKWWLYDRAELSITDRQSAEINQIFEATIPKLRESRQELDRAEEELSRTIKEHKADLATISLLVDRVESARSLNTKMRVLMLYRISLLLNPDQRVKLEALRARQDRERRDRDPAHRRRP